MSMTSITIACATPVEIPRGGRHADPRRHVTVVFTTVAATLTALRTAGTLAKDMDAQIAVVAAEAVPFHLPLHEPPVPLVFLEQQLLALARVARVERDEVRIEICLARDRRACLQQALRPHSLIVIGGGRRWWSRERRLERWLSARGHHVVYVVGKRHQQERTQRRALSMQVQLEKLWQTLLS